MQMTRAILVAVVMGYVPIVEQANAYFHDGNTLNEMCQSREVWMDALCLALIAPRVDFIPQLSPAPPAGLFLHFNRNSC